MNDKFDELAKGLRQSLSRTLLCLAAGALCVLPTRANDFNRGPLLLISSPNPLAGCDDGLHPGEFGQARCIALLDKVSEKFLVASYELLRTFDGAKGYSLAQGQ